MALHRNNCGNAQSTHGRTAEEDASKAADYAAAKEQRRQECRAKIEAERARSRTDMLSWMFTKLDVFDFVWPGFKVGTVGGLIAAGSTGKSYLALELAFCVASCKANKKLLNIATSKHGRVVIFSAEDDYDITKNRIKAICKYLDKDAAEEVAQNLYVRKFPAKVSTDLSDDVFREDLIDWAHGCRLVIFDTFNKFSGDKNENDNAQMGLLIKKYFEVAEESGAAVLILHHAGKSSSREGRQDEQESARGAGAITANMRWQGYMQKMTKEEWEQLKPCTEEHDRKKYVRWGGNKENYGADTPDSWLKRDENGVLLPHKLLSPAERKVQATAARNAKKTGCAASLKGPTEPHEEWEECLRKNAQADTKRNKQNPEEKATQPNVTSVGEEWL